MSQIQQIVREEKEAVNSLKIASFTLGAQPLYSGTLKGINELKFISILKSAHSNVRVQIKMKLPD